MTARRAQVRFRIAVALLVIALFSKMFGLAATLVWALVYLSLQAIELFIYSPRRTAARTRTAPGYFGALTLLVLNGAVFGSLSWFWPFSAGSWGLVCGGFLLAGSLLNTVLTTQGCRAAYIATVTPFLAYLFAQPLAAWLIGAGISNVASVGFGAAMMAFCALKLWRTSSAALDAERAARSDLKAREIEARKAQSFLDSIFENVPAMIIVKEADTGKFLLINRTGEQLLGLSREEVIGKTDHDLFPASQADSFVERDKATMAQNAPVVIEAEPIDTPEGVRMLRTKKVPIHEHGRPAYLLAVAEDITEERMIAAELSLAAQTAEAANQAKSTFLATMSHEIRTPLNGVLGMAQAMAAGDLSPVQRDRLDVIRQSGKALLAILNDVLDLSKIEAGKLELEEINFDLAEIVSGAHSAFTALANKNGLSFGLEISEVARGVYRGDPTRIRQILYNLISNALKFTNEGHVQVQVDWIEERLCLTVADTGIGMSDEQAEVLFQKFVQADASTTRRFGGTGLGLAICNQLVELMRGSISVESAVGAGSKFTVELPLARLTVEDISDRAVVAQTAEIHDLRVLAAEDNPVNQLVLKTLLAQAGLDPVIVANGALAIDAWLAQDWDLILMDVQMPVLDGPTACRAIRQEERELGRRRTPIIALTANAMAHHVREYLAAGMDAHVSKPIEITQLFAAIESAMGSNPDTGTEGDSSEADQPEHLGSFER